MTEEDLHNVFDSFGSVLDVSIKESSVDKVGSFYNHTYKVQNLL